MAVDRIKAARMALYAADIENLFGTILRPSPPGVPMPRGVPALPVAIAEPMTMLKFSDWEIEGQLRCDDDLSMVQHLRQLFGAGENNYFYGFLLRRLTTDPFEDFAVGDFVVLVRGTMEPVEWLLNLIALPDLLTKVQHRTAGLVPSGFWSIYQSMTLVTADRRNAPAPRAIADIVNRDNRSITVIGHSLGAALGAYLTMDLAAQVVNADNTLNAWLLACPQPGTDEFADAFRRAVAHYNTINWWRDIVPQVPPAPYSTLLNGPECQNVLRLLPTSTHPNAFGPATVTSESEPPDNPLQNHHAVNYAYMLDPTNPTAQAAALWIRAHL